MSDLFSPFRDAEQLPTPDPSGIRRRGDSLRRRRHALHAGGVAAAVAAVAFAAVSLTGVGADRSGPDIPPATQPSSPTPSPTTRPSGTVTTIPASLDLVRDWKDADGDGSEEVLESGPDVQWLGDVVECDASHSPRDEDVDHLGVRHTMPESNEARDLRVFKDDTTARRVAEDYVSWFADCPSFSLDGGASQTHNDVTPTTRKLGDQAWVVSQTYWNGRTPQLSEDALVVVRVANTVLVTQRYGEYPGATDPAATERMHTEFLDEVRPIVDDVACAFGGAC